MKPYDERDDFDAYDIECLAYVFSIAQLGIEETYADNGEVPDFVLDELHGLRDRLTRLLRKRVSQ